MSDVDTLLLMLQKDPDTVTGVCMLVDALMYERDMTRSEADRHAQIAQQSARDARDLAAAAELLRPGSESREMLLDVISVYSASGMDERTKMIVIPGSAAPELTGRNPILATGAYFAQVVTVGALWILDTHRRFVPLEPPTRLRRGTSRRKK